MFVFRYRLIFAVFFSAVLFACNRHNYTASFAPGNYRLGTTSSSALKPIEVFNADSSAGIKQAFIQHRPTIPVSDYSKKGHPYSNSSTAYIETTNALAQLGATASAPAVYKTNPEASKKTLTASYDNPDSTGNKRTRNRTVAAILAFLPFGYFGFHRFYLGYYGNGIFRFVFGLLFLFIFLLAGLVSLTGGGGTAAAVVFGIYSGLILLWGIIDFIRILTRKLQPKNGTYSN
ncbi:MAG: TM2 domain-containing protein [Bacteroidota bacterium]